TGRRRGPVELERETGDGRGRRSPLEPGKQEPFDGLGLGGRLGEPLLDVKLGWRSRPGESQVQVEVEPRAGGRQATGRQLLRQRRREPMEDEAERLEVLGGRLERQGQDQPLRGTAWPEWVQLLS